ncbi:hypothetical protein HRbin30_01155 [bacterium HR30]|nr:hypothetical protein HRbin30_01155 [bacterium HR30]
MKYDPNKHHRRSIRLKDYDYSQPGAYFITIVTQDRVCLFGDVVDTEMRLNDAGRMVQKWWGELNHKFPNVQTDEYVVMPNHFHGIVLIMSNPVGAVGADPRVCPDNSGAHMGTTGAHAVGADPCVCPDPDDPMRAHMGTRGAHAGAGGAHMGAHIGAPLPGIVRWFKTMTTNEYIRGVKQSGWPPFNGRLWQRNYYEHIIRNDESLNRIRQYIADNPRRWAFDRENPAAIAPEPENPWRI